jgi:N-acetyl-anhydromuramoyl-L-alanine amidase
LAHIVIIDALTGWIEGVRRVESPNSDERPPGAQLDLIVVHGISLPPGRFGEGWIDRFFLNELPAIADPYFATIADLKVSAHVLIGRDGALTQYVSFNRRAWHAGRSLYCGRTACNDFSIGIEVEGTDDEPYMPQQYDELAGLIRALRRAYRSLAGAAVVGHSDIAPGRKTDPGPTFDWKILHRLLGQDASSR